MTPSIWRTGRTLTASVLCVLLAAGCSSHQRIEMPGVSSATVPPSPSVDHLKAGDTVRITMRTGETLSFPIQEVQPDGLVAKGGSRFLYRDIARLEKRHFEKTKTIALAVGLGIAAFSILILVVIAAEGGPLGSGPVF